MQVGDYVRWAGSSHHNLRGIIIDCRHFGGYGREHKVIWETHTLGSLKTDPDGTWQREHNLRIVSRLEKNDENR